MPGKKPNAREKKAPLSGRQDIQTSVGFCLFLEGKNIDPMAVLPVTEFHGPFSEGEKSVVLADPYVLSGVDRSSPLPGDDVPRLDDLAVKLFYAKVLGIAVPTVCG